jgi:ATP-dependent Lon protease
MGNEPAMAGKKELDVTGAAAAEAADDAGSGEGTAPAVAAEGSPEGPVIRARARDAAGEAVAEGEARLTIPGELSILPLRDNVLFPAVVAPLTVTREASIKLIDDAAVAESRVIGVVTLRDPSVETPRFADLHPVGVAAAIRMMVKMPDHVRLIVQGLQRVRLLEPTQEEPYIRCRVEPLTTSELAPAGDEAAVEMQALLRHIGAGFQRVVEMSPNLPDELQGIPMNVQDPETLADLVAAHMPIGTADKQRVLEEVSLPARLRMLAQLMQRELNVLEVGSKIQDQVSSEMSRMQREYFLREQMKAIQKELGEGDERENEIQELKEKVAAAGLPEEALREAERELERLQRMPPAAAEYSVARTYLDWLISLPWNVTTEDNLDIPAVRAVLDEDHYGLERVKDRLLEYLSVRKFKVEGDVRQPLLCFVGPPGVGKTSLGRSIARALGRKFVRLSLGGMRDEAEIRGHRRTYVGALPGQIIQGMRRAGTRNPVMMLDEIDKVGQDFRGDPSSALLEVLDPEQNRDFRDHYLDVPFDLSRVLFITTANVLDTILPPLRDRMEVIELAGYTEEEKVEIARRHLVPKQLEEHGLGAELMTWDDDALRLVARGYTREAGVRNLEREIATITRKATREFAEGRTEPLRVTREQVRRYLGAPRFEHEEVDDAVAHCGVAVGLAWTPFGGDVLYVEAIAMPDGKGGLTLTGQLGDVMKESAQAALSYVRAHAAELGVAPDYFTRREFHLHVPAGAIPKDGPSAGVTMATAIAGLATGRKLRPRVAMTGEITLTGRVLPVGGIKEKVLAARRAGIREVILPERNRKDVDEDIPDAVKEHLTIHFTSDLSQVWRLALEEVPTCAESGLVLPAGTRSEDGKGKKRRKKEAVTAAGVGAAG